MTVQKHDDLRRYFLSLPCKIENTVLAYMNYWGELGIKFDKSKGAMIIPSIFLYNFLKLAVLTITEEPYNAKFFKEMFLVYAGIILSVEIYLNSVVGMLVGASIGGYAGLALSAVELVDDFLQYNEYTNFDITEYVENQLFGDNLVQIDIPS